MCEKRGAGGFGASEQRVWLCSVNKTLSVLKLNSSLGSSSIPVPSPPCYMSWKSPSGSQEFSRVSRSHSGQRCPEEAGPDLEQTEGCQTNLETNISNFNVFWVFFPKGKVISVRINHLLTRQWQSRQRKFSLLMV